MNKCPVCGFSSSDPAAIKKCLMFHMGITDGAVFDQWKSLHNTIESLRVRIDRGIGDKRQQNQWPIELQEAEQALARFEAEHGIDGRMEPRPMTAVEVLNRWADYAEYDPEQTRFNLLSAQYEYHKCIDNIVRFMDYDPTGALGVLYARQTFETVLQQARVKAIDIISDPHAFDQEIEMWRVFHHPDIKTIEQSLLDRIDHIVTSAIPTKMLGQRDFAAEETALVNSASAVIEQLDRCNLDVFSYAGPLENMTRFTTRILVFETLSACLLTLEAGPNGIYLCYISNKGTADGYFGFFLKSGGTLISINERIDEAYPGQHGFSRNARWTEAKADQLFPYEFVLDFAGYDYKGYATEQVIDTDQLEFFKLPAGGYLPLILAMVLLVNRYQGVDLSDQPLVYVDSLLKVNIPELPSETTALIPVVGSAIMTRNQNLDLGLTTDNLLDGSFAARFKDPGRSYKETGQFHSNDLFVQLYGQNFQLDTGDLFHKTDRLALTDGRLTLPTRETHEFVGTAKRMEVEAYREARVQLAEHIRDNMFKAYQDFGGAPAIHKWKEEIVKTNQNKLVQLCIQREYQHQNDCVPSYQDDPYSYLHRSEFSNSKFDSYDLSAFLPLNRQEYDGRWLTGRVYTRDEKNFCKIFYSFLFRDWTQLADLFGEDNIPIPIKGWVHDRIIGDNPLLNATDAVNGIGTVFEYHEIRVNRRLWTDTQWKNLFRDNWINDRDNRDHWSKATPPDTALPESTATDFSFTIGFSRREMAAMVKEYAKTIEES